ncbi:MAG: tetratricopeptide repeat protein [Anaerolineae bacterium]
MSWFPFLKKQKSKRRLAILDVGDADFRQQVLRRSFKTPVMVDYWASWCGPCRQLGPVLEKLAEEPDGDFILAKLNTEHNKRTAARYNIRSIPAVKMFRNGQVVGEFTGVMPEPLVRRFIEETTAAPAPGVKGSGKPSKRIQQAEHHLRKGKGFEAFTLLNDFPNSPQAERAGRLLPLARFLFDMEDGDGLTGLEELDAQLLAAAEGMRRRQPAHALDSLFAAVQVGESIDRPYLIEVMGSLFALLGEKHPLSQQYRPKLVALEG